MSKPRAGLEFVTFATPRSEIGPGHLPECKSLQGCQRPRTSLRESVLDPPRSTVDFNNQLRLYSVNLVDVELPSLRPTDRVDVEQPSLRPTDRVDVEQISLRSPIQGNVEQYSLRLGIPTSVEQNSLRSAHPADVEHHISDIGSGKYLPWEAVRQQLQNVSNTDNAARINKLNETGRQLGIRPPVSVPLRQPNGRYQLNGEKQRVVSTMALEHNLSLSKISELIRGQTDHDPRPNKAWEPSRLKDLLDGYKHKALLEDMARNGIQPAWIIPTPDQTKAIKNHRSASKQLNAVIKAIRAGQDVDQYLVLDISVLEVWKDIQISPLGAVEKKDCDPEEEIRLIHDLSFRSGHSTNDRSSHDGVPEIEYKSVVDIARRIEWCHLKYIGNVVRLMKGDVKGAFRHLMLSSGHVRWMAATIPEHNVLIVDMSAPFSWTSSPAYYGAVGGAISWLVGRESPASMDPNSTDMDTFYPYEWVDDHVMVEPDRGTRLQLANETLRIAMLAVLSPSAISDKKFSTWETRLQVLGLIFDTVERMISMPQDKIRKALHRVQKLQLKTRVTRTELQQVIGSLRHVCLCIHAAKAFYQHLHHVSIRVPRHGTIPLEESMLLDLQWFELILSRGQLQNLPLSQFTKSQPPDVHLYMDASNSGLAVLNLAEKQFIQVKFDEHELELIQPATGTDGFNINVLEQLCMALAVWCFGPDWKRKTLSGIIYVQAWSDNTSAISWTTRCSSRNRMAQEINRAIGLAEAIYGVRLSCGHLPVSINTMADAGSRAWTPHHAKVWSNLTSMWSQVPVPAVIRKIYTTFSHSFNPTHWPQDQDSSTKPRGEDGRLGVTNADILSGYPKTCNNTRTNSTCSPSTIGTRVQLPDRASLSAPFCPHLATLHGIISASEDIPSVSMQDTKWPCAGCKADGKKVKPYIVQAADVIFSNDSGSRTTRLEDAVAVTILFRGSKTDQAGASTSRSLHRSGSKWLCPVLAAWELKSHAMQAGPGLALCSVNSSTVLTANSLTTAIKSAVTSVGADPAQFGTHSMRSGGATAMFSAGVDRLTIKLFGRWSSDTYERYTRINELASKSLATRMTNGALSRVSPAAPVGLRPAPFSSRPR